MNTFLKDFKAFAMKGNVVDMAVGIIIGAGFGKIVSSFVNDVLMPPLGLLIGGVDFTDKVLILKEKTGNTPIVILKYGIFINTVIDFAIVAFTIFLVVKIMNNLKNENSEAPVTAIATPTTAQFNGSDTTGQLLTEIRDLLKHR